MAKLPGWLKMETVAVERDHLVVQATVRRWHPGFWWWLVCTTWRAVRDGQ